MDIKIRTQANTTIIELNGEIDLDSSPEVRKTILHETQKKHPKLIVELSGVTYMDSSGIATLVEGLQYSNQYDGQFLIANIGEGVREVFELSRLDKVFKIFNDIDQALEQIK